MNLLKVFRIDIENNQIYPKLALKTWLFTDRYLAIETHSYQSSKYTLIFRYIAYNLSIKEIHWPWLLERNESSIVKLQNGVDYMTEICFMLQNEYFPHSVCIHQILIIGLLLCRKLRNPHQPMQGIMGKR